MPRDIPIPFPIEFIAIPDTNYRKGRSVTPDMIVLHIVEGSRAACIGHFKTPGVQVSAHFLVCKDGSIVQFVGSGDTAYANGVLTNPVSEIVLKRRPQNPNNYTISIEHEGFATQDLTPAQYEASARLVRFLADKWGIPLDRSHVVGHNEITGSKSCPGLINVVKVVQRARLVAPYQ